VAEIQGKVIKEGKRNMIIRHLHANNNKEKIAAWKTDLNRILHVFNVRPIIAVRLPLTRHLQTELIINTHATVSNTQIMVSEIHRTMVQGHEGSDSKNLLVSDGHTLVIAE
jgi:hypothetical protein